MPMVDPQQLQSEMARRSTGAAPPYAAPKPAPKSPLEPPAGLTSPAVAPEAPASKMLTPPVIQVIASWTDPDGVDHDYPLTVRILTFDERVEVGRRAGKVAACPWGQLPEDEQEFLRAVTTCFVMWPDLPTELRWAITNDPIVAFELAAVVEAHRAAYFRGNPGEGEGEARRPRVAVTRAPAPPA